jgi:predicted DNA-binding transcriptional regulator AlpA
MSSFVISVQALFDALLAQGYPMIMPLHDPLLLQTLGFATIKAAQRRRERGDFPPTVRIGGRVAVMLPDLAAWLASKSAVAKADALPCIAGVNADHAPTARRRGRPRKAARAGSAS